VSLQPRRLMGSAALRCKRRRGRPRLCTRPIRDSVGVDPGYSPPRSTSLPSCPGLAPPPRTALPTPRTLLRRRSSPPSPSRSTVERESDGARAGRSRRSQEAATSGSRWVSSWRCSQNSAAEVSGTASASSTLGMSVAPAAGGKSTMAKRSSGKREPIDTFPETIHKTHRSDLNRRIRIHSLLSG
jgi:hypothetical protein